MKKIIPCIVLAFCFYLTKAIAQPEVTITATIKQANPEDFMQMLRERQKPVLVQRLQIREDLAEQIIAVQVWAAPFLRKINSDFHYDHKITLEEEILLVKELNEEKEKKYKAILQNDELAKAVTNFYTDMIRNKTWPDGVGVQRTSAQ